MSGWRAALVALVVGGGILLAGWIVSRPASDQPSDDTTAESSPVEVDSDLVLACVPALEVACEQVASELGIAFERWSPGDQLPERGVTLGPSADFEAGTEIGPVVVESPIVVAGWRTRWQVLELACGDNVDVACVASSLGSTWPDLGGNSSWGDFKLGLVDPTRSEAGMLAWSMFEPALGANGGSLAAALRTVGRDDAQLMSDLVAFGDSRADVVLTTEVSVAGQFQNAINRGGRFEIGYPELGPWMEYVAVGTGRGSDGLIETLMSEEGARRFTSAGVRPAGGVVGSLPDGLGTPGDKSPSPDDATRATLISAWEDIR